MPTTRGTRKLAFLGYALIGVGPTILLDVFAPRAFDITARKDTVDYEFRSESYAEEFADNNGAAVE
ncbi:MAG: hypothetical protein KDC87_04610 [Planctomycetes bacterium]|nr:hypothetical protein [Planctomycetota bacterium]MCB9871761.1 hypothetical protein [Planctomycetota bacterium]